MLEGYSTTGGMIDIIDDKTNHLKKDFGLS